MNARENELVNELVKKVEDLKSLGLTMNTIKRLLVEDFRILDKFPAKIGEFGTKYEVLQMAKSGDKLSKPKVLKGVKPFGTIGIGDKNIKCQFFILGNDCYIKCMDYFSPNLELDEKYNEAPLGVLTKKYMPERKEVHKKFVYVDAWGEIVLQQKAWIKITNFVFACDNMYQFKVRDLILSLQEDFHASDIRKNELMDSDFSKFWDKLISNYCKKTKSALSDEERWQIYMDKLFSMCRTILTRNNLQKSIKQCKEVMMVWSLEQTIVPKILNKKGFPMLFDDVIKEVYAEKYPEKSTT